MKISIIGIVITVLILFPRVMFLKKSPPKNVQVGIKDAPVIFQIIEIIGFSCFVELIFLNEHLKLNNINAFMIISIICILIYYGLWIRYIVHGREIIFLYQPFLYIPIPLAVFPICIVGFVALWANYISLGISTVIFAIGHLAVTWNSYKQVTKNNYKAS